MSDVLDIAGLREQRSPNHDARPAGQPVDILLLHYTGMPSARAALDRLVDPAARVSAHYLIEEDGTLWRLVPEDRRAWHAGVSRWAGATDINARSIGIELVNPGREFGYRPFPETQMAALERLATGILGRHPIPAHRVLGHSDV
ncbi:MAG: N-acetylmuramoyl-L-alanine amidase, partial [Dongiaceae bacterium]